jgi:hypothetical protein
LLSTDSQHKQQYIEQFHPALKASFFVAEKVELDFDFGQGSDFAGVHRFKKSLLSYSNPTHFTPNNFGWKARTHRVENLARVKHLVVDVDCGESRAQKADCLNDLFNRFTDDLFPSHITETRKGYHLVFKLRYPCGPNKFDMARATLDRLIEVLDGDRQAPRLNILTAIPSTPTRFILSTPSATVTCGDILRRFAKTDAPGEPRNDEQEPTLARVSPQTQIVTETRGAFVEGIRNNSIYTLLLLARDRGIPPTQAVADIEAYYMIDAGGEIDGLQETTRSAYRGGRHASNPRVRAYCLGSSVGDVSRRLGWSRGYERTMTDADLDMLRRNNLRGENTRRQQRAYEAIQFAVAKLMEQGRPVTATAIHKMSGVHQASVKKYRGFAWDTEE